MSSVVWRELWTVLSATLPQREEGLAAYEAQYLLGNARNVAQSNFCIG